jgi:putative transposase
MSDLLKPKFIRKPNRLPFKNLYQGGYWYFITICTDQSQNMFVAEPLRFQNNNFELNKLGKELEKLWQEIPELFSGVVLDEFVIMPNHFHAILGFSEKVFYKNEGKEQSLWDLIGKFKSIFWTRVKQNLRSEQSQWNHKGSATVWQKSFYDHIIRDQKDLARIREYIQNNPLNWHLDSLNPKSKMFKK